MLDLTPARHRGVPRPHGIVCGMAEGRRVAGQRWLWVRRGVLTVFMLLAVVVQFRMAQRGEATLPESLAVGVAVGGFGLLTWTRFQVQGTLVVLLSYLASAALPGSLNNGLWFLMLPLLVDANSRRPRWPGVTLVVVLTASSVFDMWGDVGSVIGQMAYTWLLSLLGMFIRNRMENTRQLERMHALERRAENQRLGALMHDAVASTLTQALAVTRDALVSGEIPEAQARGLHLVSSNLAAALDELRAIVLVLEGHAETRDGGVAVRSLGQELGQAQETLSASGFSASVRATGEWQDVELPGEVVRLVLREAVANVIRHGRPSGFVHISADVSDGLLSLAVLNQAPGPRRRFTDALGPRAPQPQATCHRARRGFRGGVVRGCLDAPCDGAADGDDPWMRR